MFCLGLIETTTSLKDWVAMIADLATVVGVMALIMTWRGLITSTSATLSQRMFDINRLELQKPELFRALGGGGLLCKENQHNGCSNLELCRRKFYSILSEVHREKYLHIDESRKARIGQAFSKVLEEVTKHACKENHSNPKKMEAELIHYLFMLFSFYEQLFILKRGTHLSFHESWENRYREHIKERPLFCMYWHASYQWQSTTEFKEFTNYIVQRNALPPPCVFDALRELNRFLWRKVEKIFACFIDCFR